MTILRFEIAWASGSSPRLVSLLDNGWEVLAEPRVDADRRLTIAWEVDDRIPHTLMWDVIVDGAPLTAVSATATWAGEAPQLLAQLPTTPAHWSDFGIVRRSSTR